MAVRATAAMAAMGIIAAMAVVITAAMAVVIIAAMAVMVITGATVVVATAGTTAAMDAVTIVAMAAMAAVAAAVTKVATRGSRVAFLPPPLMPRRPLRRHPLPNDAKARLERVDVGSPPAPLLPPLACLICVNEVGSLLRFGLFFAQ